MSLHQHRERTARRGQYSAGTHTSAATRGGARDTARALDALGVVGIRCGSGWPHSNGSREATVEFAAIRNRMTWATRSLADARSQLVGSIIDRLASERPGTSQVRLPVASAWVRRDRAGEGQEMAEVVTASYGYWNDESGRYFDIAFFGWLTDGLRTTCRITACTSTAKPSVKPRTRSSG
jgi:hypothetical protein